MHVFIFTCLSCKMSFKFENSIIDLMLCPPAQDEFKCWRLELLLLENFDKVYIDQVEDCIQILHKCIVRLEEFKCLKERYK